LFRAGPINAQFLSLLIAAFFLLHGCAASTEEVMSNGSRRRVKRSISSQFAWAVQQYEAGVYKDAVQRFERLQKEGSEVPEYDLILFYLGMSHYKLGEYERAVNELQAFLRSGSQRQEAQDGRLTLLLAFEKLARWKESSSLSSETDKLSLFQNNRALLKLIWARALVEQGELMGAKSVLENAVAYLDNVGTEEGKNLPFYSNPDQDLWGRYHFTAVLLEAGACNVNNPKEVGKNKKLYAPWLESVTDCLRKTFTHASNEIFLKESAWTDKAHASLSTAVEAFGKKIQLHLSKEAKVLAKQQSLKKSAAEALYRLLGTLDENLKNLKNQGVNASPLEQLRKQIDHLLVAVSNPS